MKITAITSGITTMRMAFMKTVPMGAEASATDMSASDPVAAASNPTAKPSTSPAAMRMCSMGGTPGWRSGAGRLARAGGAARMLRRVLPARQPRNQGIFLHPRPGDLP